MGRNFDISIGEFYHIYNRGTDKRIIFLEKIDYDRFQLLLYLCNQKKAIDLREILISGKKFSELFLEKKSDELVEIGAYCLMSNHFHILLREKVEGGTSLFMKKLSTAYTMSFNKKYKRTGALFQGRFKAKHVDDDHYFKYLFLYIHLNPVVLLEPNWKKSGIQYPKAVKKYLKEYRYSSYLEFTGEERKEKSIINLKYFPNYFEKKYDFESFFDQWIDEEREGYYSDFSEGSTFAKVEPSENTRGGARDF